ncbi:MAG: rhodanese-like domain-containing protein [Campylobacterota bacterium]|nr:rhodanese-like domain-containing protein [Campylobacterota bacterium]
MKQIILTFLLLSTALFAEVKDEYISQKFIDSKIPIVDIRTPGEWKQTGIVKNSIPIMFFNERGGYNVDAFLTELNAKVDTKKPFALICRTGSRTAMISAFLSKELGYSVINIKGGIVLAKPKNIKLVPVR